MKKTIKMEWTKSTKGTHVYASSESDAPVSSIYIKRTGLPTVAPTTITLTIDFEEQRNQE